MKMSRRIMNIFRASPKRRYAFIVTYGRSGSTLLMNIINSCDGCRIRGENNNSLYGIYQSYKKIIDAQQEHGKNSHLTSSPWWGISAVNAESYAQKLVKSFIDEVIMPGPSDTLCGFKEIRFSRREVPDLIGYINFLTKFFPGARIIFNHRDLDAVSSSKWWASMPNARNLLQDIDDRFNEVNESESFFHFYYDKAINDTTHVRDLFKFLDIPYDESAVKNVFTQRHSY